MNYSCPVRPIKNRFGVVQKQCRPLDILTAEGAVLSCESCKNEFFRREVADARPVGPLTLKSFLEDFDRKTKEASQ